MTQTQICRGVATSVSCENGYITVIYHSTRVVKASPDGIVELNTGGYRTATTKTRMNQISNQCGLGFGVFQRKGEWYVRIGDTDHMMQGQTFKFNRHTGEVLTDE